MNWLYITILVYVILAFVNLIDKYLLNSAIPNPKVYAFYVGILGSLALVLAPFTGFYVPTPFEMLLGLAAGICFIYGLFWFYKGLHSFEASRIVPAVGGLTPIFTYSFIYVFSRGNESLPTYAVIAFLLLVAGSVIIVSERNKFVNFKSLEFSAISAFFMALSFALAKYLYLALPFWTGFIWKSIGGALLAVAFFVIFPEIRKEIFLSFSAFLNRNKNQAVPKEQKENSNHRFIVPSAIIFLGDQSMGAVASILQNWAVALAPLAYVAFINALQGVQYAILFIFAVFLSLNFPQILKEEISKRVMVQKVAAILIIGAGLALISIK